MQCRNKRVVVQQARVSAPDPAKEALPTESLTVIASIEVEAEQGNKARQVARKLGRAKPRATASISPRHGE